MASWVECKGTDKKPIYVNVRRAVTIVQVRDGLTQIRFSHRGDDFVEVEDEADTILERARFEDGLSTVLVRGAIPDGGIPPTP